MLKQGNTRFLPQALTKQQRRIDGDGKHGRRYRLRNVVMIGEVLGITLEVDLETRIARFHHDVVVRQMHQLLKLSLHAAEAVVCEFERSEISFQIEPGDLSCQACVVSVFEYFQRNRSGFEMTID